MCSWTKEQVLRMISLYEDHPLLYDCHNPNYTDRVLRAKAMQGIADGLRDIRPGTTPNDIKAKWKTIRSQRAKEVEKIKKTQTSGASTDSVHVTKLFFFEALKFLENYRTMTPSTSNLDEVTLPASPGSSLLITESNIQNLSASDAEFPVSQESDPVSPDVGCSGTQEIRRPRKRQYSSLEEHAKSALEAAKEMAERIQTKETEDELNAKLILSKVKKIKNAKKKSELWWKLQMVVRKYEEEEEEKEM